MITLPSVGLLFNVSGGRQRARGRVMVRGSPDIFVKLLRENVGADLPIDMLTDFEPRSHISKVSNEISA